MAAASLQSSALQGDGDGGSGAARGERLPQRAAEVQRPASVFAIACSPAHQSLRFLQPKRLVARAQRCRAEEAEAGDANWGAVWAAGGWGEALGAGPTFGAARAASSRTRTHQEASAGVNAAAPRAHGLAPAKPGVAAAAAALGSGGAVGGAVGAAGAPKPPLEALGLHEARVGEDGPVGGTHGLVVLGAGAWLGCRRDEPALALAVLLALAGKQDGGPLRLSHARVGVQLAILGADGPVVPRARLGGGAARTRGAVGRAASGA